jgi:hypothetical protein
MITVQPLTFTKVDFDAAVLARLAAESLARIVALPEDLVVEIRIDEDQATSRLAVASLDPVTFDIDGGAIENRRLPRTCGEIESAVAFTRLFLEVADRRSERFGAPRLEAEVTVAHKVAWEVNLYGRTARLGLELHHPRFRYYFRHGHGFSDNADRTFDELWSADDLDWARIVELSDRAIDTVVTGI